MTTAYILFMDTCLTLILCTHFAKFILSADCHDEEKDAFIEKLEQVSSVDNAVIMGDFNTQVGCHAEDKDAFTEKLDLISG